MIFLLSLLCSTGNYNETIIQDYHPKLKFQTWLFRNAKMVENRGHHRFKERFWTSCTISWVRWGYPTFWVCVNNMHTCVIYQSWKFHEWQNVNVPKFNSHACLMVERLDSVDFTDLYLLCAQKRCMQVDLFNFIHCKCRFKQ